VQATMLSELSSKCEALRVIYAQSSPCVNLFMHKDFFFLVKLSAQYFFFSMCDPFSFK